MGEKIDGKAIAAELRALVKKGVDELIKEKKITPGFSVILVGDRGDSAVYVRMKQKAAEEAGMCFTLIQLAGDISEKALIDEIKKLNDNPSIHGIIVQLPLPDHINEKNALDAVAFEKDIDGFHPQNIGCVAMRGREPHFIPCTPEGITIMLDTIDVDLTGKKAVVLGRSNIVGVPIALLLLKRNCTVTICHSKTKNIEQEIQSADVLVAAIGQPNFVKGEWVKKGAIVIDVGTNAIPDSTKKNGVRLVGDVEYKIAKENASFITPVPGGVGPMTVATLLKHVLKSAQRSCGF